MRGHSRGHLQIRIFDDLKKNENFFDFLSHGFKKNQNVFDILSHVVEIRFSNFCLGHFGEVWAILGRFGTSGEIDRMDT